MKPFLITLAALAMLTSAAFADEYVHGYTRSNGTYVQPYHRTEADYTPANNYSTPGNYNPYQPQQASNYDAPTYHYEGSNLQRAVEHRY